MAEKILIVDDDLDTLRLVGLLLQRKGYQIVAADNGVQALDKAQAELPDLILLDVMMPDMDGVEVLRRLRNNASTADIPIIMFTAKTQVEDKVTGFEAGADDYLTKPTHPAELTARVRTILARSVGKKKTPTEAAPKKEKGRVIGVLAAKGGLGVTTVALNLGIMLRKTTGKSVTVAELRPGLGNMSLLLGAKEQAGLNTILRKDAGSITPIDLQGALIRHDSGVDLLLASYQPADTKYLNAGEQMAAAVEQLSFLSNFVVLDLGAGLLPSLEKVIERCDQIVVVIEPAINTVIQTKALLEELSMKVLGLGNLQIVQLNRVNNDKQMNMRDIQNHLGHSVSAIIGAAPELAYEAAAQGVPLALARQDSPVTQQFQKLAEIAVKA